MSGAWKPRSVSFSSGGVRLIGQLGALARPWEAGILDEVQSWYGCSGGCIPALLGAMGCTPSWIADLARIMELWPYMQYDAESLGAFPECWGINDGAALLEFMCRSMETWHPGSSRWTFADLQRECGSSLICVATNLTRSCQEIFSVEKTPHVPIMDGVRASMAIPLFFTPSWSPTGDCLCDGGVMEYFAWQCVPNKKETLVVANDDYMMPGRPVVALQPRNLGEFIRRILYVNQHLSRKAEAPRFWIALNDTVNFLDFNISLEDRMALYEQGRVAVGGWLAFRARTSAAAGTAGSRPSCGGQNISDAGRPSQNRTSDSHQSRSPPQPPYPSRGSPRAGPPPARRWSL